MVAAKLVLISLLSTVALGLSAATGSQNRGEILQLGARLHTLEKELGKHNDRHLKALEEIRRLETEVSERSEELKNAQKMGEKREEELAQILRSYHLAMIDEEAVPSPQYVELVRQNRAKARALAQEREELLRVVTEFHERLGVLRRDESELGRLAHELEIRKKNLAETYQAKLDIKENEDAKRENIRISARAKALVSSVVEARDVPAALRFTSPLDDTYEIKASEKGVTLMFEHLQPIKAPRAGRVVYNGDLSSYGKVLMIDHGNDIRTVMLGRFQSRLQKNDKVQTGDTLGYTEAAKDSLYFEVRKKNVAQKTIHWLGPATVGKI